MYAEQPSTDQLRAIEEIKRLRAERYKLIQAVADHVTVRAEQYQRIQALEAQARDHLAQLGAERNRALKAEQERDALRSQLDRVTWALEHLLERGIAPPDRNCSCHISPPCNDCVEWSGLREAVEHAESALAAVREPADHIEHDLEKVRGPTSSPAGEGGE